MTSVRTKGTALPAAIAQSSGGYVLSTLRSRIADGTYPANSVVPSRRALCAELGVAVLTVDRAMKLLVEEGLLRSEPRRGTFVTDFKNIEGSIHPAIEIPARQPWPLSNRRVGIIDIGSDLTTIRPASAWSVYMIVHAAEEQIFHMSSRIVYPGTYIPDDEADNYSTMVRQIAEQGMESLVVVAYNERNWALEQTLAAAEQLEIPPVIVSATARDSRVPIVFTDNQRAGRSASEHLLEAGYRRLLFLAPYRAEWQEQRIQGIHDVLSGLGRRAEELRVERATKAELQEPEEDIRCEAFVRRVLDESPTYDAIIGANDKVAVYAARFLKERGVALGTDIGIMGFDDDPLARENNMTSIRFPLEAMGREAALLALRMASGEMLQHHVGIGCSVIARISTMKASALSDAGMAVSRYGY